VLLVKAVLVVRTEVLLIKGDLVNGFIFELKNSKSVGVDKFGRSFLLNGEETSVVSPTMSRAQSSARIS
jgi:hypothetical protein